MFASVARTCADGSGLRSRSMASASSRSTTSSSANCAERRKDSAWSGDDDLVLAARNGQPLRQENVRRRVLKPTAEEAGVPSAGFHTFRHTCATRLFAEGRNAVQLSRWLGHHSPAFTLRVYVGLLDGDLGAPLASSPNGLWRALHALEGASIGSAQATDSRGFDAQQVA